MAMKTYSPKESEIDRKWWLVDAEGKVLGRLASTLAHILRGKHKPYFSPHVDCGDFVVVINVEKLYFTGNKRENKLYYKHSGYPGGLKAVPLSTMLARKPEATMLYSLK